MSQLEAVFFDVGDTLVFDDPPIWLRFAEAARVAGYVVDHAQLMPAWRSAEQVALADYLQGTDTDDTHVQRQSAAAALRVLGYDVPTDGQWSALAEAFACVPFERYVPPQIFELLDMLHDRGLRLGVISDWEETLPDVLDKLQLSGRFETVSVSAAVGYRKPDARLFEHALAQMAVTPDQALHVGDWLELDVRGAEQVGLPALLFDHARRAPYALCPRVETFAALAAYLDMLTAPG